MASPDANKISEGLSKVAHAIRRSTAIEVAVSITEPGTPMSEVFQRADEIAVWINGSAGASEEGRPKWQPPIE